MEPTVMKPAMVLPLVVAARVQMTTVQDVIGTVKVAVKYSAEYRHWPGGFSAQRLVQHQPRADDPPGKSLPPRRSRPSPKPDVASALSRHCVRLEVAGLPPIHPPVCLIEPFALSPIRRHQRYVHVPGCNR